jgi:hypothetical protein
MTHLALNWMRYGRLFPLFVVGRARPAYALAAPSTPAARHAPSLVIGRHSRRLAAAIRARRGGVFWSNASSNFDGLSSSTVSARAHGGRNSPFPIEFQFATLNLQRRGPRAPKANESSTPGFRPGREPRPATSRENAAVAIPGPPASRQDPLTATPRLFLEPDSAD